jgi:hypothetical protein
MGVLRTELGDALLTETGDRLALEPMKRYYICRRIGSGTSLDPYNSELRVYLRETHPTAPRHLQQVIAHTCPWVLMKYDLGAATHLAAMTALPGLFSFPAGATDRLLSALPGPQQLAIWTKLAATGFGIGWIDSSTTVRRVIDYIAHSIQISEWAEVPLASCTLETTLGGLSTAASARVSEHLQDLGINASALTASSRLQDVVALVQQQCALRQQRWFHGDEEAD